MNKHIISLKDYVLSLSDCERVEFAEMCGTKLGQLQQIYYGNRKCDAGLAVEIEKNSNRVVLADDLRPDVDFQYLRQTGTEDTSDV